MKDDVKYRDAEILKVKPRPPPEEYDIMWYTKRNPETMGKPPGVTRDRKVILSLRVKSLQLPPHVEKELIDLAKVFSSHFTDALYKRNPEVGGSALSLYVRKSLVV